MSTLRVRLASVREFDALVVVSLLWFFGKFVRYSFPPLFETFRAEYAASPATLGLLYSALLLAYAGMQFPSGVLSDHLGPARVITAGALVASGAAGLLFALQAFPVLVVAVVLIGLGTGVHKTVAIDLLARVYPARTGRTLGVMDAIGGMAGVAAPAAVVLVLSSALGWNVLFLLAGVVGIALAAAFALRIPRHLSGDRNEKSDGRDQSGRPGDRDDADTDVDTDTGGPTARSYLAAFADARFSLFVAAAVAFAFAWNGVIAFLPLFLTSGKALSVELAGLFYGGLFLVGLIQPATGALADRIGRLPVMLAVMGVGVVGIGFLVASVHPVAIAVAVSLIGVGGHGVRPPRDSHLVEVIPPSVTGGTLGIVRTAMTAVAAAAPAVVGALSETAGFPVAFLVLAGAILVAIVAVAVLLIRRTPA